MYKFVVCKDEDMPISSKRDSNTLYYIYDKLLLYKGRVLYTDPFALVTDVPTELPPDYMLYISIPDGKVYQSYDKILTLIAELEDKTQLDYLKATGSTYFMKSDYRYLDTQRKSIILPYRNGSYQLGVSLANDIKIDKNLEIKFDPKNSRFIFDGNLQEPDEEPNPDGSWKRISHYEGGETDTAIDVVEDGVVKTYLKISKNVNNMLELYGDGLFVYTGNKVKLADFEKLVNTYNQFQVSIQDFEDRVSGVVKDTNDTLNTLPEKILEAMDEYNSTMSEVLEKYDVIAKEMEKVKANTTDYVDKSISELYDQVEKYLKSINNKNWVFF